MLPSEPNRKIEETLKAYARRRRLDAGAPLSVDGPTRNLLQNQVTRTFRAPGGEQPANTPILPLLWQRLILTGAGLALLLVSAGLWLRFTQDREESSAPDQESKLLLFAQNPPATPEPLASNAVDRATLPERVRGFEIAASSGKATEAETPPTLPPGRELARKETSLSAGGFELGQPAEPVHVALGSAVTEPDVASNAPRFPSQLPNTGSTLSQKTELQGKDVASGGGEKKVVALERLS